MNLERDFLSIQNHCVELSGYFSTLSSFQGYEGADVISNWLALAACIHEIDYDISIFDTGGGVCGLADIWAEKQGRYQKKLIKEIVRFQFCWNATEAIIDYWILPIYKKEKGKINNACSFLKNFFPVSVSLQGYKELINKLDDLAKNPQLFNELRNLKQNNFISEEGVGLYRVYSLRNKLAHGTFNIPTIDHEEKTTPDLELLEDCIRVILLTLQMISIGKFGKEELEIFLNSKGVIISIGTAEYLKNIHLKDGIDLCTYELA